MASNPEYSTTGKPHPYHIVRPSIWPFAGSVAGGIFAMGMVMYMHDVEVLGMKPGIWAPLAGVLSIMLVMFYWWKDVLFEAVTEKAHTDIAMIGMRYGMVLFIASEVMFFVAFFWAFFSAAFYPTEAIGFMWPPEGMKTIPPFELPFLMTMILLLSGCTVTWAHHAIIEGKNQEAAKALGFTVFLGFFFLCFQVYEYSHALNYFGFTDGIYPSTFYMATGFHGFHVFVGTIFLLVCWIRTVKGHFTPDHHFGFEAAAWYWHFVDVVWLFLFIAVYWWGNVIGVDMSEAQNVITPAASN
ncbi:MAG: cytochrome c oxidase subunit 3 [Alphaproteobacteria bacterium]